MIILQNYIIFEPCNVQAVLESISDVFSLQFNPVKPTIIAGGCFNGQVQIIRFLFQYSS